MPFILDDASRVWASAHYSIPLDTIEAVDIYEDVSRSGCPTCGYGGESTYEVFIRLMDGSYESHIFKGFKEFLQALLDAE